MKSVYLFCYVTLDVVSKPVDGCSPSGTGTALALTLYRASTIGLSPSNSGQYDAPAELYPHVHGFSEVPLIDRQAFPGIHRIGPALGDAGAAAQRNSAGSGHGARCGAPD